VAWDDGDHDELQRVDAPAGVDRLRQWDDRCRRLGSAERPAKARPINLALGAIVWVSSCRSTAPSIGGLRLSVRDIHKHPSAAFSMIALCAQHGIRTPDPAPVTRGHLAATANARRLPTPGHYLKLG
jgi:hypothetical protein